MVECPVALKSLKNSQNITTEIVTDLGLSKPADETGIPKDGEQKILENSFYNIHGKDLALKICNGYRPEIPSNIAIPQLLIDPIKRCWDAKSEQRPISEELVDDFHNYKSRRRG
ncbi:hypothetical protein Glove_327g40 [Diversispora epigaea]|uniref:Serine-threonine/tyrosine-protein kinase catalytic domain-containing protein n=1 Tax=Diversispora epigaea TaxID=1348612 RepID=A0A397HR97_9GLOM|nr:hypothetical protein Glove_327g40 [Diversispora epigaea]